MTVLVAGAGFPRPSRRIARNGTKPAQFWVDARSMPGVRCNRPSGPGGGDVTQTSARARSRNEHPGKRSTPAAETAGASDGPRDAFYPREVIKILGLSRRQLQYWASTDLVRPSIETAGGHHRYTFEDLVALRAAKRLIDAGVSVQRIRSSIRALRRILPGVQRPLAERVLVATGDVVLVIQDGTAFETATGQGWIFEVRELVEEIESWRARATKDGGEAPPDVAEPPRPGPRSVRSRAARGMTRSA